MEAGGLLPRQPAQGPPGVAPSTINVCAGQGPNGHAGNVPAATIHELNAAAAAGQLNIASQQQLHLQQQQHLQQHQQQQQMGQAPGMGEVLTPKRQAVVDRLRRRIENYRRRQTDCIPRFDQSFNGLCEQNVQDTLVLKQRFLENKAKRQAKKTDKKQTDPVGLSNVHVQKFLKRTAEELVEPPNASTAEANFGEPPVKLQCSQSQHQHQQGPGGGAGGGPHHSHGQHQPGNGANSTGPTSGTGGGGAGSGNEGLTKFSVEIVQQLEFTTSAANSQAQQISTNVTVKALTNASVKSDLLNASSSPKSGPDTPASTTARQQAGNGAGAPGPGASSTTGPGGGGGIGCVDIGNLVECKQEPGIENEFVDLEQCAAALEKDAAANGTASGFPGFSEFMGDDTGDEIITSDAFKDLISEISDFHPEFMKEFDFEEKSVDTMAGNNAATTVAATVVNNNNNANNVLPTNNGQIKIEDDKDAIHQQQQQQPHGNGANNGVNSNANSNNGNAVPANSSPGALGSSQYSPARLPYSSLDFKSEMSPAAQTLKQMAEQHQHKNQQLGLSGYNPTAAAAAAAAAARGPTARSPYAEFPQFGGASDYLGSPGSAGPTANQTQPAAGAASYHKNNGTPTFQNQQASDMFVGSQTQFPAGLAEMKRPQPGTGGKPTMLGPSGGYKQQYSPYGSPGSMPNHGSPGYPLPPRGSQGGPNQTGSQGPFNNSTPPRPPSGPGTSNLQINQAQQMHINNPPHPIQVSAGQHMQLSADMKPGVSVTAQQGMYFNQQQTQNQAGPGNQADTYCSVSQSQTINFTQQSLRQRAAAAGGVPQPGSAAGARGHPQQVPTNQVDQHQHAKILQQQQLMRAQQVMQQQQHMAGGMSSVRPPPPEYKAAAQAQMMHASIGMSQQARFANASAMRRVTQQPMPPSGPMMRPQMAQQQQQALHAAGGNMYMGGGGMAAIGGMHQMHQRLNYPRTNNQRPPNVSVGPPDGLGNSIAGRGAQQEWRHVLMQQQGFQAQMRSQFNQQGHQGGFMNPAGNMQMTAAQMQHQLIRSQNGGITGSSMANSTQMQQLLSQQHQQQTLAMQQNNSQMSLQMQISQASSVSAVNATGTGSPLHPHQYGAGSPGVRSLPQQHTQPPATTTDPSVSAADFSLEFLENLPTGDASSFNAQDLLNTLDTAANFNLDIL